MSKGSNLMKLRKKQRGKKPKAYPMEPPCLHNSQSQIDEDDPLWVPDLGELDTRKRIQRNIA